MEKIYGWLLNVIIPGSSNPDATNPDPLGIGVGEKLKAAEAALQALLDDIGYRISNIEYRVGGYIL